MPRYFGNMNHFGECQFTVEDLRDCALLLDAKNPKLYDICKKQIGEIYDLVVVVLLHCPLTYSSIYLSRFT